MMQHQLLELFNRVVFTWATEQWEWIQMLMWYNCMNTGSDYSMKQYVHMGTWSFLDDWTILKVVRANKLLLQTTSCCCVEFTEIEVQLEVIKGTASSLLLWINTQLSFLFPDGENTKGGWSEEERSRTSGPLMRRGKVISDRANYFLCFIRMQH